MTLAARLKIYAPDGAMLGVLRHPSAWSASLPWNDIPAMQLQAPVAGPDTGLLGEPVEVALEVNHGDGWVEPANARYRRLSVVADAAQRQADVVSYAMPGYGDLLDGVTVIPAKFGDPAMFDEDGKRKFLSASVGEILITVLDEARALVDDLVPGVELAFTKAKDARGADWNRRVTIYYEPGMSLLTILANLADQGQCDWWLQGRTLHVVNADTTVTHTDIRLQGSPAQHPIRSSLSGLLHTAFLVGEEETWRADNPSTITPWGTSMRVLTQGGVRDQATALQLIGAELEAGERERVEYTWSANLRATNDLPFRDYGVGDWIHAPTKTAAFEEMRVHQVTLSWGEAGLDATLVLNDRFLDREVRAAKRTRGIVRGATGDAGTGTIPGGRKPAAPLPVTGLVADSEGYWTAAGQARSFVTASWAPVTHDVRGSSARIKHYRVQAGDTTVYALDPTVTVSDLEPGVPVTIRVWAVDEDGLSSAVRAIAVTTKFPLERLHPPTSLGLSAEYGIVTVLWDRKLQETGHQPVNRPRHYSHIYVEEAQGSGGPWTRVGTLVADVLVLDRQDIIGETRFYRGIAVDILGGESDPGPATSVEVRSVVADALGQLEDDIDQVAQDNNTALSNLTNDLAGLGDATSGVKFVAGPPTEPGRRAGDTWFELDSNGNSVGLWRWNGNEWVDTALEDAMFGFIGVDRIRAKGGHFDSAVIDQLGVDGLDARMVRTSALYVAAGNLIPNGDGRIDHTAHQLWQYSEGDVPADADAVGGWTATGGGDRIHGGTDARIKVNPSEPHILTFWARQSETGTFRFALATYDENYQQVNYTYRGSSAYNNYGEWGRYVIDVPTTWLTGQYVEFHLRNSTSASIRTAGWDLRPKVGGRIIVDGSIGADKVEADQAMFDKLFTEEFASGKVTAQMFHTNAAFTGPGVSISRAGINITGSGGQAFQADSAGNVTMAGTFRTQPSGQRVQIGRTADGGDYQWFRDSQNNTRIGLGFRSANALGELVMYDTNGVDRFHLDARGYMSFESPAGRDSLTIQNSDSNSQAFAWIKGPETSSAATEIGMGQYSISSTATTTGMRLGTFHDTNDNPSSADLFANGTWKIGSDNRGYIRLTNGGELIIYQRTNLLSLYNLPETSLTGQPITMIVSGTGRPSIYRNTSVRASKLDIQDVGADPYKVLDVPIRDWLDRHQYKAYADQLELSSMGLTDEVNDWDLSQHPRRIPGIIAEELEEAGLDEFCSYDEAGELVGVQYDRVALLLIPIVKDLLDRIATLERN